MEDIGNVNKRFRTAHNCMRHIIFVINRTFPQGLFTRLLIRNCLNSINYW